MAAAAGVPVALISASAASGGGNAFGGSPDSECAACLDRLGAEIGDVRQIIEQALAQRYGPGALSGATKLSPGLVGGGGHLQQARLSSALGEAIHGASQSEVVVGGLGGSAGSAMTASSGSASSPGGRGRAPASGVSKSAGLTASGSTGRRRRALSSTARKLVASAGGKGRMQQAKSASVEPSQQQSLLMMQPVLGMGMDEFCGNSSTASGAGRKDSGEVTITTPNGTTTTTTTTRKGRAGGRESQFSLPWPDSAASPASVADPLMAARMSACTSSASASTSLPFHAEVMKATSGETSDGGSGPPGSRVVGTLLHMVERLTGSHMGQHHHGKHGPLTSYAASSGGGSEADASGGGGGGGKKVTSVEGRVYASLEDDDDVSALDSISGVHARGVSGFSTGTSAGTDAPLLMPTTTSRRGARGTWYQR